MVEGVGVGVGRGMEGRGVGWGWGGGRAVTSGGWGRDILNLAAPAFYHIQHSLIKRIRIIVEDAGFEPGTAASTVWRAFTINQK